MTTKELQQLKDLLFKFEDWNCDIIHCGDCPMYTRTKGGSRLCGDINEVVSKYRE